MSTSPVPRRQAVVPAAPVGPPNPQTRTRLNTLCPRHEEEEWRGTYLQYRAQQRNQQGPAPIASADPQQRSEGAKIEEVPTLGVIEILALVEQRETAVIIDTGACVSCIDEKLIVNKDSIRSVHGVDMRTATEEPVKIIGRTDIHLVINYWVVRFPVFVARGVGECCILGSDFHMRYKTVVDYGERHVDFKTNGGRVIRTPFLSREKSAKYLRTMPNPSWLNEIQLIEPQTKAATIRCANTVEIPPRSQRLLKISYVGPPPRLGVVEGKYELFRDESVIIPPGLITTPPPDSVLVANLSNNIKQLRKGEVIAEIRELEEVKEEDVLQAEDSGAQESQFEGSQLNINPNLRPAERQALVGLLKEYKDRFAWDTTQIGRTNVCELGIDLVDDTPIHQPPYRVSHKEREVIRSQVTEMLDRGVIQPSKSAYASPVVLVKKKDGDWRFCVDYRQLNERLISNVYPLPLIEDILTYLNGCKWFTTLDMNSGYWQIPIKVQDRHCTAFITPDGLWEFTVTPFGLKTSPAVFQSCMDQVLAGLKWGSCLVYLDDVLVMAPEFDTMLDRLRQVLERLRAAAMTLNPRKCSFGYGEVKVLGHQVNEHGVSPDPSKIRDVQNFRTPRRVRDVRSFIGLCNYYRKFIQDFSKLAHPLTKLTRKDTKFEWGPSQEEAFQTLKDKLTSSPVLKHFDPTLPVEVHTDASDIGVGAVLVQLRGEEGPHPVAYASRKLSDAETRYTTTEKECIGAVWAVQHFRNFLWGRHFTIVVDHHALCWLHKNKESSGRLARWALKLMEYDYTIRHKQGRLHVVPDCLSRNPCEVEDPRDEDRTNEIPMLALGLQDLSQMQQQDEECKRISAAVRDPEKAASRDRRMCRSYVIEDGVLYRKNTAHLGGAKLLVVPKELRKEILFECHDSPLSGGHLGFSKTFTKIKSRYYWPEILKDTEKYVKTCLDCQTRKTPKQAPAGLLQPIPVGKAFQRLGIDFLGPFRRSSRGKVYIIVAVDYATKWVEAEATRTTDAVETAKFLIDRIICKYGCPEEILTDRGSNFKSTLVLELMKGLGVRTSFTTAYHPMCNGLVEHFNGTLAQMLSHYVSTDQKDWDLYLNLTCFSYNTSKQETTQHTPFYLLFGREARLPIDVALGQDPNRHHDAEEILHRVRKCREDVTELIKKSQEKQKKRYDQRHRHVEYSEGSSVMVWTPTRKKGKTTKLLHRWHGPYQVCKKLNDLNYEIKIVPRGRRTMYYDTIHVSRLKPYYAR